MGRPSLQTVLHYRADVNERIFDTLAAVLADGSSVIQADLVALITLGLHHEQQHQELLLTDIKHALSLNPCSTHLTRISSAGRWHVTRPLSRNLPSDAE